jgi:hypothetical protein
MSATTNQTDQVINTRRNIPTREERTEVVSKEFSGFRLRLSRDAIGKKKLSNRLTITVPDSRSESLIKMTIREARALQTFLNKYLPAE